MAEMNDDQKIQVRLLFAEDMVKKQYPQKTQEVLADYSRYYQPGLIKEG